LSQSFFAVTGWGFDFGAALLLFTEKLRAQRAAPKGASDSEELTVSLKRYPDTEHEFFSTELEFFSELFSRAG
jgi:hypothetical protein